MGGYPLAFFSLYEHVTYRLYVYISISVGCGVRGPISMGMHGDEGTSRGGTGTFVAPDAENCIRLTEGRVGNKIWFVCGGAGLGREYRE